MGACDRGGDIAGLQPEDAGTPEDAAVFIKMDMIGITINMDVPPIADARQVTCTPDPNGGCAIPPGCGDGTLTDDEECDDGNTESSDGCSVACRQETDFVCPDPGQPCVSTVVCADGRVSGKEACDDRNTEDGDGCSADCSQVEPGWVCKAPGVRCQPKCGDGVLTGWEECDDGNANPGDGCGEACKLEAGYACPVEG